MSRFSEFIKQQLVNCFVAVGYGIAVIAFGLVATKYWPEYSILSIGLFIVFIFIFENVKGIRKIRRDEKMKGKHKR